MDRVYESVIEACRLRAFMPDSREFVKGMADAYGCRPLKADGENLYDFLQAIYNAGRIAGIRSERQRGRGCSQ